MVRTSMGPNGMNKMVINHLERLFVTSDARTIVTELEVQHPAGGRLSPRVPLERIDSVCARHAAKILTLSANRQWTEVTSRGPLCLYTARFDTIVASGRRR